MTTIVIRKRLNVLMILSMLAAGFVATFGATAAADELDQRSPLDRRHEQIGTWFCSGVTTAPYGTERPYYATLTNEWTEDGVLHIHFEELNPVTETPLIEDQYWSYDPKTNTHTRTIVANDGSFGELSSDGWQKHTLFWTGTFTAGGTTFDYEETITRLSAVRYRWTGVILYDTQVVLTYDVTCTRQ